MRMLQKSKWIYLFSLSCFLLAGLSILLVYQEPNVEVVQTEKINKMNYYRGLFADQLGPSLLQSEFPEEVLIKEETQAIKGRVIYTIDPELQKASEKLLESYKPDYGAIVIMEADSGKVLALTSFQKKQRIDTNLAFRGSFPAASVFKIVTAAAAMDKLEDVTPETQIAFNGGNHTLYKKNVMNGNVNKWTRYISLREAFARSINTVFGRLTLERLKPEDLEEYAVKFGFNKNIKTDLPYDPGKTEIPKEKNFHLTEMASGFNKVTTMSPVQGAMIAASIAADGVMPVPYVVDKVLDPQGETLFKAEPLVAGITMSKNGAEKIQELMEATITQGTSRKSFRSLVRDKKFKELLIGGKTGSLTGDDPKGKVDWFVGYAMNEKQKVAIAALTVNVQFWTVKSAYLAQTLFKTHFKEQFSKANERFFAEPSIREPSSSKD